MTTEQRAAWSTAFINTLPDASFLYIEPGGTKDQSGRTTPRSLRHFPVKDGSGKVDVPHLLNAMAQIPKANLSQAIKDRMAAAAQKMHDAMNREAPQDQTENRSEPEIGRAHV